ncbi:MAG: DUF2341 domain-containing protein, partial [Candidatus Saccharibacteria bacterium]|nr:DUF2341 domain-containing protein [Candidatus Saccharibacteria bacterium]
EEESWSGGAGTDATANYWVKVPTVATAADTDIYIYYGKSDATDGQDAINVWDANFKGVWHLPDGTTLTAYDSTTNVNHGSISGATAQSAGKVNGAANLDGVNDYINVGTNLDFGDNATYTISAWVYLTTLQDSAGVVSKLNSLRNGGPYVYVNIIDSTGLLSTFINGSWRTSSSTGIEINNWYRVVYKYDGSSINWFVNDTSYGSYTTSYTDASVDTSVFIGNWSTNDNKSVKGRIDEVRISSTARPAEWMKFEYYNMNEADNELSLASQEAVSFFNQGWLYRKKITIDHTYVDSDLTDFPLYVKLDPSGSGLGLGSKIRDDGYDVRFTSADGTA